MLNSKNPLNRPVVLSNLFWTILVLILLAGAVFFGYKYFILQKESEVTKATLKTRQINEKVLNFSKLFIESVLKAETEVDFETRLKLENLVRDLDDEEILTQWNSFVNSKSESEAQNQVKNLLELLVNKIRL